ncbi:MAG: hypothetical protein A2Y98_03565 [Candidatus Portnoybacteria bacterium RBG_19FT_COMBO_36_7]|uniref:Uncharacterized protein n=1 Tax=Candidatus Portnoybacteria bacterium RBG_19FT_COMBO_36_7 TaxID=1801992 RepID=A0A1G2F8V4_9BACT|nr:MAG: hypothetical protein A2Y98_03565 [Candidatus Portnoybacteria bacterium RBG_19FT_COMBO_36_7]
MGGIPPRPSVPPERSGGGQSGFSAKWVLTFSNKHHHIELVASPRSFVKTAKEPVKYRLELHFNKRKFFSYLNN